MSADTIFALSSGVLPSGVAIIRVSGVQVPAVIGCLLDRTLKPRLVYFGEFRNSANGELLDQGLALFFPGPKSFTGEDVLELHCHGGVATVEAVLTVLANMDGLRLAERGEFSRRAFENGRLDLTELEGLSDLIAAQSQSQRKLALSQAGGSLRALYDDWRNDLIRARALIEAELDFADEDDVPGSVSQQVWQQVSDLNVRLAAHLDDQRVGEIVRRGFRIALLGPVNAGKSSLLNHLAKREVAIVTPQAGTTRDAIEVTLKIGEHLVVVTDTAGFRDADDIVELEGMRRARLAGKEADLVLWLQPVDDPVGPDDELITNGADLVVINSKSDLAGNLLHPDQISVHTNSMDGVAPLLELLENRLDRLVPVGDDPVITRQRHRDALNETCHHLTQASLPLELEIRSEYLRLAADSLGRLTGRIDVEDLLDVIFNEFCIGK